ncbi:alpha/beta fold hydrolase [Paucibacter sp. TC2R-5]|uniref:alpha/beta hydrolase n=1 Tax=Paucibacter sp. TC2R-5 TaxID=2893555 RepID=UPI0021E40228|nr:alpha/beta hydrolase [Paucibacter sp. TC2R-5]MCV2358415.1 alpha/beta fold hydrolase [Paucibacter sp. TC2R-5]
MSDELPSQLDQLDAHLAAAEARLHDVTPGAEKQIVWGAAGRVRAPWAVVYLHGFTATRQEMAPLPELLAQGLGGHVFYTRLSGHGRPGAAMAGMSVAQWQADALEALALGHQLGERVLVMGTSTGATLAAWAALQPQGRDVAAWVLVSPNFGPKDRFAALINWSWGRALIHWVHGGVMRYKPGNATKARYWTHEYPTSALDPMMALVRQVRASKLEAVTAPLLMLLSPRDSVINVADARAAFKRVGSASKCLIEVDYSESAGQHVLAGDIEAPKATATMAAQVLAFIKGLKPV